MLASPAPGPAQASKPEMGLRTLIPTEGPLQYNYYPVCELPTQGWGSVFPGGPVVKNSPANSGDLGSIPGSGRSPGGGNGNLLQYSFLENPMDQGALWATIHGVAKSRTRLTDFSFFLFIF